jgi:hypothetical protein
MKNRKGTGRGVEEGGKLVVRSGGNGGKEIRKHDLDVVLRPRKCLGLGYMSWPQAAEYNMITNKQKYLLKYSRHRSRFWILFTPPSMEFRSNGFPHIM